MDFDQFSKRYQKAKVEHFPHRVQVQPMVSIMVQTFQHKNYIHNCLDSILNQVTNFPYEILLGEDSSTDGTRDVCLEYAQKYPKKIRLFLHHPANKIRVSNSVTGNFNAIYNFFSANGKYIAFCEGDDLWMDPLKLQKQVDYLTDNKKFILAYHSFREITCTGQPFPKKKILDQPNHDLKRKELQRLCYHPLLSTICFRKYFMDIPEEVAEVINIDSFLISMLGNYGEAKYLEDINPTLYRRHQDGIWTGRTKELKYHSKIITFRKLVHYYHQQEKPYLVKFFKKKIQEIQNTLFLYYLKKGQIKECFQMISTSTREID